MEADKQCRECMYKYDKAPVTIAELLARRVNRQPAPESQH